MHCKVQSLVNVVNITDEKSSISPNDKNVHSHPSLSSLSVQPSLLSIGSGLDIFVQSVWPLLLRKFVKQAFWGEIRKKIKIKNLKIER